MTLTDRIILLASLGLTYDEKSRSFKGEKGKIDQDIVQYGTDELFEKWIKKLRK